MLNNCTLKESRTWLLVCTRHYYFIPFNHEHPVILTSPSGIPTLFNYNSKAIATIIIVSSNAEKFRLLHHTLIRREIESTFFAI